MRTFPSIPQIYAIWVVSFLLLSNKLELSCKINYNENIGEFKSVFMKTCVIVPQLALKVISNRNELLRYIEGVMDVGTQAREKFLNLKVVS